MMNLIPFFILISSVFFSSGEATQSSFTVNLIHRDSIISPYYNSSARYNELIKGMLYRANRRSSSISSPLRGDHWEYLMKISVGTPPRHYLSVADTGSDLLWIQCKPCIECYKQDSSLFDPEQSSTYEKQPCDSNACQLLPPPSCVANRYCNYEAVYKDRSISLGDLSWESFTFELISGKPVVLSKVTFGCGHLNRGFFDKFTAGIVGLGNSDLSIVNQLGNTVNRKFSYCMVPLIFNMSSKISFGNAAVVQGSGVQTTPYFTRVADPFYYLNLESVSIGDTNIKFESKIFSKNSLKNYGNIAIDSGTTITFFPSDFYQMIEDEVKRIISSTPVSGEFGLSLCYKNEKGFAEKVPTFTFHFTGAKWELGVLNTMLLSFEENKICLSMAPGSPPILGNLQQMDHLVGYDLISKTLSFKKTNCAKLY